MELVFFFFFFFCIFVLWFCFIIVLQLCFAWLVGWLGVWDSFQADGFFHFISFDFISFLVIPTLLDSCCLLNTIVSSNILGESQVNNYTVLFMDINNIHSTKPFQNRLDIKKYAKGNLRSKLQNCR